MDEPAGKDEIRELVAAIARLHDQQRTVHESFLQTLKELAQTVKALHDRVELVEHQVLRLSGADPPTRQ